MEDRIEKKLIILLF